LCVVFDPEGRRLVSSSDDGAVKLWDVTTGQAVLTLRSDSGSVPSVAVRLDGRGIAAACGDQTVKLWDAAPLAPEGRVAREARDVVEFQFDQSLSIAEVSDRIRHDPTLSPGVRQSALDLVEPYGRYRLVHQAERVVFALYAEASLRPEVLERLRTPSSLSLSEPVREQALALASVISEDVVRLNGASWGMVWQPGAEPAVVNRALELATAACRLVPDEGALLNTLGVAQYRAGKHEEALATLSRSLPINSAVLGGSAQPADLAFTALAQHRLGQTSLARATLARLRETVQRPEWARDGEALSFLREAEAIELDPVFPADPFAP
jgi:hypothetical protein